MATSSPTTANPTVPTSSPTPPTLSPYSPGLDPGAQAGSAIAAVVGAIVLLLLLAYALRARHARPPGVAFSPVGRE